MYVLTPPQDLPRGSSAVMLSLKNSISTRIGVSISISIGISISISICISISISIGISTAKRGTVSVLFLRVLCAPRHTKHSQQSQIT